MSTFSFYPNYTKYIVIEVLDIIPHGKSSTVNILFYLIDIGVITNIPTPQLIDMKPILIYKIYSDHFVKVYYINVKKNRHIVFNTRNLKCRWYVVRDGPDLSSTILPFPGNIGTTSTFQCTILAVTLYANAYCHGDVIRYVSKYNVVAKHFIIDHKTNTIMYMPFRGCPKNYCAVSFHAQNKYQVNITVLNVTIKSNKNWKCTYTGMLAVDNYKDETLCENQKRMFYSFNSSLTLALYWYKELQSMITGLMKISTTLCSFVQIDPCYIEIVCAKDEIECSTYLKAATEFSNIVLLYKYSTLSITQMEETCTILQVSTSYNLAFSNDEELVAYKYPDMCKLFVTQANRISSVHHVIFSSYKMWLYDTFVYQDTTLRYCKRQKNTSLFCVTNIDQTKVPRLTYYLRDNEMSTSTLIHTRNLSDHEVIEIAVSFSYKTKNWIHMLIRKLQQLELKIFAREFTHLEKLIDVETSSSPMTILSATILVVVNMKEKNVKHKPFSLSITMIQKSRFYAYENLFGWTNWFFDEHLIFASKYQA